MTSTSKGEQWGLWPLKALAHPILHIPPLLKQMTSAPLNIMKHFTACNIQFPECRRCTVCLLRNCASHYSICIQQHVIPAVQHLHAVVFVFLNFLLMISLIGNTVVGVLLYSVDRNPCFFLFSYIFCDDSTNWEYCRISVIIFCGPQPPQFPLIVHYVHYMYMSCGASTKTIYVFWRLWSMDYKLMEKHNFIFLSNAPIFIFKQCRPGKAYRWRGAPAPCVCRYMYLQISSQANIVSRPHTLQMSVWYDSHWHRLLRNRCMKPSVVEMQKTVPLCCDLYQNTTFVPAA